MLLRAFSMNCFVRNFRSILDLCSQWLAQIVGSLLLLDRIGFPSSRQSCFDSNKLFTRYLNSSVDNLSASEAPCSFDTLPFSWSRLILIEKLFGSDIFCELQQLFISNSGASLSSICLTALFCSTNNQLLFFIRLVV